MNHAEILSRLIDDPTSDVLYAITMQQVIQQIAHRMGEDALSLTRADLELAREEVIAALEQYLADQERDVISIGLDAFEILKEKP